MSTPDMDAIARRSRVRSEPDPAVLQAAIVEVGEEGPYTGEVHHGWMGWGSRRGDRGIRLTVRNVGTTQLEIYAVSRARPGIAYQRREGDAWEFDPVGVCGNSLAGFTNLALSAGDSIEAQVPVMTWWAEYRVGFMLRRPHSREWTRVWSPAIPALPPEAGPPLHEAPAIARAELFSMMEGPFGVGLGDLDCDGVGEVAVSNRNLHDDRVANTVKILAGGSGAVVRTLEGGPGFGYRLGAAGDVDADGWPDLLVTTGDRPQQAHAVVEIVSGRTGERLADVEGDGIGGDLAAVGDVNADGRADFAMTVDRSPNFGVACVSGKDGSLLWTVMKPAVEEGHYYPGFSGVTAIGDVDGDGARDIAFAGPSPPDDPKGWGRLYLLSSATGTELAVLGDGMGAGEAHESVASIADFDGDGCEDILARGVLGNTWCVRVVSSRTRAILLSVTEPVPNYGWSVAALGDVTGDSIADFAVGAPPFDDSSAVGRVFLYSGRNCALLDVFEGPDDDECMFAPSFGICLEPVGDFNADRVPDLLVGEEREFGHGSAGTDRTWILSGSSWASAAARDEPGSR